MRTTLVLDDKLFAAAKQHAAAHGLSLSEVVNRALREALLAPVRAAAEPFQMPTFGGGGRKVRHTPADLARALEQDGGV